MMLTLFEKILLGHLVGDYLLQSKKMAIMKSEKGWQGFMWCLLHCLVYTAAVCCFTGTTDLLKISLIFISHFPIDRWSMAKRWLKLIKGRDLPLAIKSGSQIDLVFSGIVYVVVDNTWHLLLEVLIFSCF